MEKNTKVSEDENAVERLKMSLEQKSPALVLGAGFSFGARNQKSEKMPMAAELTEKIYNYCFRDSKLSMELEEDRKAALDYKNSGDLKGLCSLIRAEGDERLQLRNLYLTKIFSNCSVEKDSYYFYLTEYKWSRIFTLNIDDLVEYLYHTRMEKLAVWSGATNKYKKVRLIPF